MPAPTSTTDPTDRLWTVHDVAAYLQVSRRTVQTIAANDPTFPQRLRVSTQAHRWVPSEVRQWALRQRRPRQRLVNALD